MAGLFEFLRSMGAAGLNDYLANRARRNALNDAGLFMTNPGFAAPVADYDMFAPGEIDVISDIIRRNGDPDFFNDVVRDRHGNVTRRTPVTPDERIRRIQNAIGDSSPFTQYTRDHINQAIEARRNAYNAANATNRAARQRYEMWDNGRRLAGTNMTWNSELAHQKANTFKRWFRGGGIIDPLLMAYALYDSDDKEQTFKDAISVPSILGTAGAGATLGSLGAMVTGGGLGTGALAGAVGSAAPLAALAGGYWLGSKLDKATGASSKIANGIWNLVHDDAAERAENDRKAAANPEVANAKKFLNIRNNLVNTYGLSKVQANEIANRVMAGTSMEQALQNAGIVIPGVDTTTPAIQNNTVPKKANTTSSGVNYLDSVTAQNTETLPNSRLRVYDRDGNFLRYI